MNPKLKEKVLESLAAVLPITLIVMALSVILVPMDVGTSVMFPVGAVLLVFGMGLFQLEREIAMTPLGEGIGVEMERVKRIPVIVGIAFLMGVIIHDCRAGSSGAGAAGSFRAKQGFDLRGGGRCRRVSGSGCFAYSQAHQPFQAAAGSVRLAGDYFNLCA